MNGNSIKMALWTIAGGYLLYIAWQLLASDTAVMVQKGIGVGLGLCGVLIFARGAIGLWKNTKPSSLDRSEKED